MSIKLALFMAVCCLLAGTGHLHAQATTSTLNGIVTDEKGEALIAATVVATHEPSGTLYGVTTREDGRYTIPNMRVGGPYKVEASYVGYKSEAYTDVSMVLAQKLTLNFVLESQSQDLSEVVVTGQSDLVLNNERTGAATSINSDLLQRLPTISRSASDYYRLTPASDGNSFGGRNDQYNNFSLDGSIFNNPFGLDAATPGGQTDAQPISLDAIEQIQISLAPYDVTQSGFTGASIDAVTKSGTNAIHGTVFGFYRNQDLTGSKVNGKSIFVPSLTQLQTGFSLGGPIIKNKLFFFVNAELERREDLGSNFIAAGTNRSGENVARVEVQDLEAVSNALQQRFSYATGAYENYEHQTSNEKAILKLDWNINSSNTLTATYNFLNAFKDKPAHPSAIGRRGPDFFTLQFENSGYRINNKIQSGIMELKSIFGNKAANKLKVGYTSFRDSRDPFSSPFPVININKDGIRYIVAGHEPFSINNVLDQDVFHATDNFNIYAGDHTITIGGSFERFEFNNSFNLDAYGGTFSPGFETVAAFLDSVQTGSFDDDVAFARRPIGESDWALAETNLGQLAFYAQDEWNIGRDFTLTYGLRMDMPLYFDTPDKIQEVIDRNCCFVPDLTYFDEDGNPIVFDHTQLPDQTPLFSPRVGFNWDILGNSTMQLRGGSGLFTGRFPFVWIGNQVANPNFFFYNVTRPDFKYPQVWRTNLGFDRKFGGDWVLSADLIYTKDVNAMMVRNYGIKPPSGKLVGPDGRAIYQASDRTVPFANNAYVFTNTDLGETFNATLQLQRYWQNGLYTTLSYNFLDAKDASSIEAEISSDAFDRNPALGHVNEAVLTSSLYGNRHRIVGAAHKKFEYGGVWATTISLFMQYAQGGRFTYTYSGDLNGDGSFLNDLIYIPTTSELGQTQFSGSAEEQTAQRNAFDAFIQQDEYLSGRRGEYAEKYAILSPWYSNWDVRILQDYKVGNNTIQFSLDVLNVGNLISNKWGVRQFPTNTQPVGVSVANSVPTYSFDTDLETTFTDDFSLLSRWQLQVGLRYIF
ncbi:MAG: carboxypeptidase regulatory-like domain-containing protein [Saprospiraceae bacterium]|nr:carboxypeptidase regulatory-like domain-containing protein [Saprospiraceae bacterium]MDZ4705416.1 carboxypeptidase regulatory-like domain-containing protein [Saprospiraceae bacterium]